MCTTSRAMQQYGDFSGLQENRTTLSVVLEDIAARFILTCPDEEFESFERLFFQIEVNIEKF